MAINLDRSKILETARQQFAKLGLKKTSLSDITRPLGVGKTAIYHHFPGGKSELMEAVMHQEEESILTHMRAAILSESDPRNQFRAMIISKITDGQRLKELLDVPRDVGEEIALIYADRQLSYNRKELDLIKGIIESGVEKKIFFSPDPLRLASVLQAIMRNMEMTLVFEMSPEEMKQLLNDLLDIIFNGILVASEKNRKG